MVPFDVVTVIKQSVRIHSRSVLVSAIFEKNDEQGGEDCLSSCRLIPMSYKELKYRLL